MRVPFRTVKLRDSELGTLPIQAVNTKDSSVKVSCREKVVWCGQMDLCTKDSGSEIKEKVKLMDASSMKF